MRIIDKRKYEISLDALSHGDIFEADNKIYMKCKLYFASDTVTCIDLRTGEDRAFDVSTKVNLIDTAQLIIFGSED